MSAWAYLDPDQALAEGRSRDLQSSPRGPLHGVPVAVKDMCDTRDMPTSYGSTEHWLKADDWTRSAIEAAAAKLENKGHQIVEIELPSECSGLNDDHQVIRVVEAFRVHERDFRNNAPLMSPRLRAMLNEGELSQVSRYERALRKTEAARNRVRANFDNADVLLTPSVIGEAPLGRESIRDPLFNRMWTSLHLPCLTLPFGSGPNNLPIGVQLVGAFGHDQELLDHAAIIEAALE